MAGYLFSLILSATIVVLLAADLAPVRVLERAGIDLGMRMFAAFQPAWDPAFREAAHTYIFVDIDDGVCRSDPAEPLWTCPPDEPAPPPLVRELISLASASGAAVIIVDLVAPRAPEDRQALVDVASGGAGPLVIVPLVANPKGDRVNLFPAEDPLIPAPFAQGRLRLAPMVTRLDPKAGDGVIRHYPAYASVGDVDLPTAPLLAAAWIGQGAIRIRIACAMYQMESAGCARAPGDPLQRIAEQRLAPIVQLPPGELAPVFWTLPHTAEDRTDFEPTLQYVRASEARMPDGGLDLHADAFSGRVVVIGSSSPRARDLHLTPLRVMSGSELILNAVRSFVEFGRMRESRASSSVADALETFRAKASGALLPALLVFPAWWLIYWSRIRTAGRTWPVRMAAATASVALFAALLFFGMLIELLHGVTSIRRNAMLGIPVDLVTPIAALGLEVLADVSKSLILRLEAFTISFLALISPWGRVLMGYLRRQLRKPAK